MPQVRFQPLSQETAAYIVSKMPEFKLHPSNPRVITVADTASLTKLQSAFPYNSNDYVCPQCRRFPAGSKRHLENTGYINADGDFEMFKSGIRQNEAAVFTKRKGRDTYNKVCDQCNAKTRQRLTNQREEQRAAEGLPPGRRRRRTKAEMEADRANGNPHPHLTATPTPATPPPPTSPDLSAILARLDAQDARIAELERSNAELVRSNDDKSNTITELKARLEEVATREPPAPTPTPTPTTPPPLAIQDMTNIQGQLKELYDRMDAIAENAGDRLEWLEERVLPEPEPVADGQAGAAVEKEEEDDEPGGSPAVQEEWAQARAQTAREFAEFEEQRRAYRAAHGLD